MTMPQGFASSLGVMQLVGAALVFIGPKRFWWRAQLAKARRRSRSTRGMSTNRNALAGGLAVSGLCFILIGISLAHTVGLSVPSGIAQSEEYSAGPNNGGVFVNDNTVGVVPWKKPGNVQYSDDLYAVAMLSHREETYYLKVTDFGFDIPAEGKISGILVEVEKHSRNPEVKDYSVKIVKDGNVAGIDHAIAGSWVSSWPPSDTYITHGSSSDLWGTTWTASDINSNGFGLAISAYDYYETYCIAYLDHVRITVFYSASSMCDIQTCASGQQLDPVACSCVQVQCSAGSHWDAGQNKCVADTYTDSLMNPVSLALIGIVLAVFSIAALVICVSRRRKAERRDPRDKDRAS